MTEQGSARYLPLIRRLEQAAKAGTPYILAIDGPAAGGKSTLAAGLAARFCAALFHMDDFFLPPERKTQERLQTPGGNVDYERFLIEVLQPLSRGETVQYRRYHCKSGLYLPTEPIPPRAISIIEGAYAMHPALMSYYNCTVYLDVDEDTQRQRILARNGAQQAKRFQEEWIPMERLYFRAFSIASICDIVL